MKWCPDGIQILIFNMKEITLAYILILKIRIERKMSNVRERKLLDHDLK